MTRRTAKCPVCNGHKRLLECGLLSWHTYFNEPCSGWLLSPWRSLTAPVVDEWSRGRRDAIKRDNGRCRKCFTSSGLEVHHIKERSHGGGHDLDNLITLCTACHAECTYSGYEPLTFDQWLALPPARWLVTAFAQEWPSDVDAATYKDRLLWAFASLVATKTGKT